MFHVLHLLKYKNKFYTHVRLIVVYNVFEKILLCEDGKNYSQHIYSFSWCQLSKSVLHFYKYIIFLVSRRHYYKIYAMCIILFKFKNFNWFKFKHEKYWSVSTSYFTYLTIFISKTAILKCYYNYVIDN